MKSHLAWFFIAALAYFLAGRFGLLMAIPPGFASAVWPASGIALACLLLGRTGATTLGIGIGSFLINLGISSGNYASINIDTIMPAFFISLGAMLQARFGAWLFVKFLGPTSAIDSPKNISSFILIVSAMGCLVSATVGVSTLFFNNIIGSDNYGFSWLTWWAGDAIGVLLFTPMTLTLFSIKPKLSRSRKYYTTIPTLVIFVGVLTLFFLSLENRRQQIQKEVEESAHRSFTLLDNNLQSSIDFLAAYSGFFQASESVTFAEFNLFFSSLLKENKIFHGVGWTRIVDRENRSVVEAEIQSYNFPEFTFKELSNEGKLIPAKTREQYYPVLYIYPIDINRAAFGFDLGSNTARLFTLQKAKSLRKPQATSPIRLVQETESEMATIVYYPVFKPRKNTSTLVFEGYVSGVIRMSGILGNLINEARSKHFDLVIEDQTVPSDSKLLNAAAFAPMTNFEPIIHQVDFAGRKLGFKFFPTINYRLESRDWTSYTVLTVGLILTALLQAFILVLTGRTESIKLEVAKKTKDLMQAKIAAEDANKAKTEFTANISHELRTPLNAIVGLLNQCMKTELSTKQFNYLHNIHLASETLTSVINSTLDFSKIEAGRLELENSRFNLTRLLKKLHAIFKHKADESQLTFEIKTPETFPTFVFGDQLRLEQVLLNLLSNAFKFTKTGGITLALKQTSSTKVNTPTESSTHIQFLVSDTGIGIPSASQNVLFESFRQADSSTSRHFGGTGLGLTISRKLVELMGGELLFNSVENQGSQFFFEITFEIAGTENTSSTQLQNEFKQASVDTSPVVRSEEQTLGGKRILIVEDVELNQIVAEEILKEHGANIEIANNGVEAIERLKIDKQFDLILMDIQMPGMDGYEATEWIKQNSSTRHIPVVAMTANAMNEDIEHCLKVGMQSHIAKPIDEQHLIQCINHQLEN